ncbi:MAG: alcohol dehydrogenase catalytic domain-containing protein [Planctomycetota bacterium]|jgi:threonine dehydrogenase-like Zn-dependent dehydrogenase
MSTTEPRPMLAAHLREGTLTLDSQRPRPEPLPGESRVAVSLAGVCATDLALAKGYMGFRGVPGHEFVGRALDGPLAGKRVVGEINAGCGVCERCRSGDPRHCSERSVLGILLRPGAFAEELRLPDANLLEVPEAVSDEAAVFTEPIAAAGAILEQVGDVSGLPTLVVGDGRLGLCCAAVLAIHGARVELLGRHPGRADLLPGGVRHLGRPLEAGAPPTRRYPLVVEASGRPESLAAALAWTEPRGRLVLKTTTERPVELDLAPLVVDEIQLLGSRCGRFDVALEWLASGALDPRPWIAARFPLSQVEQALAEAGRGGVLKVLLDITPA